MHYCLMQYNNCNISILFHRQGGREGDTVARDSVTEGPSGCHETTKWRCNEFRCESRDCREAGNNVSAQCCG